MKILMPVLVWIVFTLLWHYLNDFSFESSVIIGCIASAQVGLAIQINEKKGGSQ